MDSKKADVKIARRWLRILNFWGSTGLDGAISRVRPRILGACVLFFSDIPWDGPGSLAMVPIIP